MPLVNTLRDEHGVGPVCHELDIAPSTYYRHQQHRRHPERRSQRVQRDDLLKPEIQRGMMKTTACTVCTRSGDSCCGKASVWPDGRWMTVRGRRTGLFMKGAGQASVRKRKKMPLHEGQQEPATWLQSYLVMEGQKKRYQRC